MNLIKNRRIVADAWVHVDDAAELPARGQLIVSLARYREQRALWQRHSGSMGVRLCSHHEAKEVAPLLQELSLVAVEFPGFKDGRGYTTARLLRERFGFRGELRAVGDVMRDQLFYMERCGFDAFELKAGKSLQDALGAFSEFSVSYQGAADEPRPLFRRRAHG